MGKGSTIATYFIIAVILFKTLNKLQNIVIFCVSEGLLILLFLISSMRGYVAHVEWMDVCKQLLIIYIPLAVGAYNIKNRECLFRFLYIVALISVPLLSGAAWLSYGTWTDSYDMSLGYSMVFSVLVLCVNYSLYFHIYDLLLAVYLSGFILFIGSRGPFICVLAFILIQMLLSNQYSPQKKMVLIAVGAIVLWILWINFEEILAFVYQTSEELGFDSRSIRLLLEGEALTHDSGRNSLLEYYSYYIEKEPIWGYGLMGKWIASESYPHNFVVEIILAFGYPFGLLILGCTFFVFYKGIRSADKYKTALAVLFVSYCTHLFVSGSFLKVWQFWLCIAICMTPNRNRNEAIRKRNRFKRKATTMRKSLKAGSIYEY